MQEWQHIETAPFDRDRINAGFDLLDELIAEQPRHQADGVGRFDEADVLAQKRLKKMPDDTDAYRALAYNASSREDYRTAHDWNQRIVDTGKAEAQDLNGLAWETLFYDRAEGPDIETAIRATQMSQNAPNILHTLACLYAEAGKTKEAREVLIQAMDLLRAVLRDNLAHRAELVGTMAAS
jgi:Flp pilus assembly protein TadD